MLISRCICIYIYMKNAFIWAFSHKPDNTSLGSVEIPTFDRFAEFISELPGHLICCYTHQGSSTCNVEYPLHFRMFFNSILTNFLYLFHIKGIYTLWRFKSTLET